MGACTEAVGTQEREPAMLRSEGGEGSETSPGRLDAKAIPATRRTWE